MSYDSYLDERATDAVRQSQELRADRARLGHARGAGLAAFHALRQETAALTERCHDRRRTLEESLERWADRGQRVRTR